MIWRFKLTTIGLIGGFSPVATQFYYQKIAKKISEPNQYRDVMMLLCHINQVEIICEVAANNWFNVYKKLLSVINILLDNNAKIILLPCNTLHKIFFCQNFKITAPILKIMDAVGRRINHLNYKHLLIIGSKITMHDGFYHKHLFNNYTVNIVSPSESDSLYIDNFIFTKLINNNYCVNDLKVFSQFCHSLYFLYKVDAILLACTELFLVKPYIAVPCIDSAEIHVDDLFEWLHDDLSQ